MTEQDILDKAFHIIMQRMVETGQAPFYIELAKLEKEFKQASGIDAKIKMTIAEMVMQF